MNKLIQNVYGLQSKNGGISLEPRSQINDLPESLQVLEGQMRECFGRVVYSHKTHEKCADILLETPVKNEIGTLIVLSSITDSWMLFFAVSVRKKSGQSLLVLFLQFFSALLCTRRTII